MKEELELIERLLKYEPDNKLLLERYEVLVNALEFKYYTENND